jgi:hypothetical protein
MNTKFDSISSINPQHVAHRQGPRGATLALLAWMALGFTVPILDARGQGQIVLANRINYAPAAFNQTGHIWGPSATAPTLSLIGLGSNDNPSGTTPFGSASGMALIGQGTSGYTSTNQDAFHLGYHTTLAQLIGALGQNIPESALVPLAGVTTFRTGGTTLGGLALALSTFTNNPASLDAPWATVEIVAWDNSSGQYPTWTQASAAWLTGYIPAGHSAPINVANISGPMNPYPYLTSAGSQINGFSFNLFFTNPQPPSVSCQPPSQTAEQGTTVTWSAHASGAPPFRYQWFLNGTNLSGGPADKHLSVTNVQFDQSGACTVVVTNLFGTATSLPALVNVVPPVARRVVPDLRLTGAPGSSLEVDYADLLSPPGNWSVLGTLSMNSASQNYFDLSDPLPGRRLYRATQISGLRVPPVLDLRMVPALTLTGNLGASLRVDYISRYGPTDAWVTLDTVTMTNTSQLYFDTSAPGQPERLYRLVPIP